MGIIELFKKGQKNTNDEEPPGNSEVNEMIKGIRNLEETTVKEVMVPRVDVVFIPSDIGIEDFCDLLSESGHSRFPVSTETSDDVAGVLYAKDLIRYIQKREDVDLLSIAREPYFVPDSMKLNSLLREFKKRRVHIAVVVDEYGGVAGIVCLEDIIEEIVGDIQDEFDQEEEEIIVAGENIYICDARLSLSEFNEKFGGGIPEDQFETLGGFVFGLFGKIPVKYEKITSGNFDFIIQSVEGHKIQTIKVVIHPQDEETDDEDESEHKDRGRD